MMITKMTPKQNLLRTVALTITAMGAIISLYFMFIAGSEQKSILLIGLFTGWVLSPFVGLFIADKISKHWVVPARLSLYLLMLILTICSIVAYSGVLTLADTKPAFIFLIIPMLSWLLIVTIFLVARKISNKNFNQ